MITDHTVRTTSMILDLSDVARSDTARGAVIGGKAEGLVDLIRAGERTPAGFVVPDASIAELDAPVLTAALAGLGTDTVAVRSSGASEDGLVQSLAGAHATELHVPNTPEAVLAAVRRVHASGEDVSVVVQPMVDALASGVAFSVNPVTGDDEVVVAAVAGLGDALVAGEVDGDAWTVRGEEVTGSGVPGEARVRELAVAVRRLAARRGGPVDVEWSIDRGTGDLVLLQCRPVTAAPLEPVIEVPPGTWEKDVAHSPGPLSPMTTSIAMMDEEMFADWTARFGFVVKTVRFLYFGGEEYSQVVPLIGDPASSSPPPPWWALGALARIVPPLRRRMRTAAQVLRSGLLDDLPRRWAEEWRPEFETATAALRGVDVRALDDAALVAHAEEALARLRRGTAIHFDLFVPYLVHVHAFVLAAERHLGWTTAQCLEALAGHSPASAAASRSLDALAGSLATPAIRDVLADPAAVSTEHLLARLAATDPAAEAAVREWVDIEGFRTTDYDVASPTVGEVPGLVVQLLRAAVDRAAADRRTPAEVDDVPAAIAALPTAEREEVTAALGRAREVFGLREENVRLIGLVPIAAVRRAILEAGRRAVVRGLLDDAELTMMLTWPELRDALLATGTTADLSAIARRRRREQAWVLAHPGPLHHGPAPVPPPDMRGLPAAGRTLNQALMWAISEELSPPPPAPADDGVAGTPCGSGTHTGPVRIVRDASDFARLQPGDVLVCPIATPAWAALFSLAGAVVCDGGGPLSHTAIVAREHGLPTVMGAGNATSALRDGDLVTVDGTSGRVTPATR